MADLRLVQPGAEVQNDDAPDWVERGREADEMRRVARVMRDSAATLGDESEMGALFSRWATRLAMYACVKSPATSGDRQFGEED